MRRAGLAIAVLTLLTGVMWAQDEPPNRTKSTVDLSKIVRNVEIVYDLGFESRLEVENGDGYYILHIGQIHAVFGMDGANYARIVQNQRKIYNLILALQQSNKNVSHIFHEGWIAETVIDMRLVIELVKLGLESDDVGQEWFKEATLIFKKMDAELYGKFPELIRDQVCYMYRRRAEAVYQKIVDNSATVSDEVKKLFDELLKVIGDPDGKLENKILCQGAVEKLNLDGLVILLAAETEAGQLEAIAADDRRSDFIMKVGPKLNRWESGKNDKEILEAYQEFTRLTNEYNEKVFDAREEIFLELLSNSKGLPSNQKLIPLVYGDAHDFSDNIRRWNERHPNKRFGLVRFTPVSR